MGLPLRPLELKQLFDFSIRVYRGRFAPMVLLAAILQAPISAFGTVAFYHYISVFTNLQQEAQKAQDTPGAPPPDFAEIEQMFGGNWQLWIVLGGIGIIALILYFGLLPLINIAVSRLAVCSVMGEECTVREALGHAARHYWPTQIAMFVFAMPVYLLVLLVLIPAGITSAVSSDPAALGAALLATLGFGWIGFAALYFLSYRYVPVFSGAMQAVEDPPFGVDGTWPHAIWLLKRSWGLTQKFYWRIFGLLLLLAIAVGVIQNGVSKSVDLIVWLIWLPTHMPPAGKGEEQFMTIVQSSNDATVMAWTLAISSLFGLLMPAFILCYKTLLYLDLRFRHEGYDLELLLEKQPKVAPAPVATNPSGAIEHVGI
jgi:hypothetical protein